MAKTKIDLEELVTIIWDRAEGVMRDIVAEREHSKSKMQALTEAKMDAAKNYSAKIEKLEDLVIVSRTRIDTIDRLNTNQSEIIADLKKQIEVLTAINNVTKGVKSE